MQRCFDVVLMSGTDAVSALCNVENPTSDFVSTSDVDPTLKCWLSISLDCNMIPCLFELNFVFFLPAYIFL